ncbi:Exocyst complex component 7 [Hordeum vulgare]|nr:Exocyst complex component 7 [Hordeum vulgare]
MKRLMRIFLTEEDIASGVVPLTEEPSWAKKLKKKMKKLFYLHAKGQYRAHAANKAAISRHKVLGRQIGLMIESGSEDRFTDEDTWIARHCSWDSNVELPSSLAPRGTVQRSVESGEY